MLGEPDLRKYADALLRCSVNDIEQISAEIRRATESLASLDLDAMEARLNSCEELCERMLDNDCRAQLELPADSTQDRSERGAAIHRLRSAALVHAALLRRSRTWVRTCENLLYSSERDYSGTQAGPIRLGS